LIIGAIRKLKREIGTGSLSDIGFGNGLYHTLNIPLKSGLSGSNFLDLFKMITESCLESYQPEAIVMECGADGLAGDPLKGNWNLDIKSVGDAVSHILSFRKPTLLFGGGGYSPPLAAKCFAYCTAVALGMQNTLPEDIPEHDFFEAYGPDFTIWNDPSNAPDLNKVEGYAEQVAEKAKSIIRNLKASQLRG
jgi:acetoin utilization deacetylase AcuC-like enzyme